MLPQAGFVPDTIRTSCACACFSDTHVCDRRLSLCLIQCAQGVLVLAFPTRMCATGFVPDTIRTSCACACFSDTHVCDRRLSLCLIQCAQGVLVLAFPTRMCATAGWACA